MAELKDPKPRFIIPTMICIVCEKREGCHYSSEKKDKFIIITVRDIIFIQVLKYQTLSDSNMRKMHEYIII